MTMTTRTTRWVWLPLVCWSAAAATTPSSPKTTAAATIPNNSPSSLAFLAPSTTSFLRHQQQLRRQLEGHEPTLLRHSSASVQAARARERVSARAEPRPRGGSAVLACMSDAPLDEEQREGGDKSVIRSSRRGSSSILGFFLTAACSSAFPRCASATTAAAAAAAVEVVGDAGGGEMGARLDGPAAISFGAVVVAFAFLQARIRIAVRARTARRDYEVLFKGMKAKQLAGQVDEEEVALVEERMSQLLREEQEAKMVDIFGIPFNLVIPDGGAGGEVQQGRSSGGGGGSTGAGREGGGGGDIDPQRQQQQRPLGIREMMKANTESDLRDGKLREEEMSQGATLKVAALWLVLISQLWLLLVLWSDPMGPATSAFLKD